MLSSQQKVDIARNRHIVKEIIDVLILCGHQNIAIREGEGGSYRRRKKFYVNFASCVQARRNTAVPNSMIKYTSLDIQNKIIEIIGEMVGDKIVRACNDFEYFGLIDDEATGL